MCGIAGIIGINNRSTVNDMLLATRHRGPDDHGIYDDNDCSIGMNRLSILDLSQAGHQPMFSDDKRYVIVYNGEVYNFREIRKELEKAGYEFHSHTDTEVVLKGYIAYGRKILDKLRGMFAFVVWDTETKTAFGARDHMGIKPFYYHHKDGVFTFCSEIKGMLQQPVIKKQVSNEGLRLFLTYGYVGAPYTILNNVFALKPGECFTLDNGTLQIDTYWDIPAHSPTSLGYDEARHKLKDLVVEKVNEELVSDVPLGLFLSGGLDSTVVLAAMRLSGKKQIETFSLGFEGFDASEDEEAAIAARHFNTNHHTHIISGKTVADEFDGFIDAMDQPSIDGLNVYLVSKYTRQYVTVALSGLGPDELFLGYKWQRSAAADPLINTTLFNLLHPLLNKLTPKRYKGILAYLKNIQDPVTFYASINRILFDEKLHQLNFSQEQNREWVNLYDNPDEKEIYSRISRLDMKLFMGSRVLSISDATSMYHSLEVRFPLIDRELVEFSRTLPASYKTDLEKARNIRPWSKFEGIETYEGSGVKKILYEAFKPELPAGFGTRAKKGFKFPYEQWMKNELKPFGFTTSESENIPEGWHKLILLNWLKKHNIALID